MTQSPPNRSGGSPVMAGAAAISCQGNDTALLFFHGFTGSPYEGRYFADYFCRLGYTVDVPLLPGHGTRPEDLLGIPYQNWLDFATDKYQILRNRYRRVIVCGQSMGGALALHVAAHHPVDGLVTMAAATFLKDWRLRLLPLARRLITYQHKSKGADIRDKQAKAESATYPRYPISSLEEFLKLIAHVRAELPKITSPALLIHSRRDHTITWENLPYIAEHISSERKEVLSLESSYHVISVDEERETIFARVEHFLEEFKPGADSATDSDNLSKKFTTE